MYPPFGEQVQKRNGEPNIDLAGKRGPHGERSEKVPRIDIIPGRVGHPNGAHLRVRFGGLADSADHRHIKETGAEFCEEHLPGPEGMLHISVATMRAIP